MHSLFPAPRDFVTLVDGGRVRHEANLRTGIDWLALLNLLVVHATPKLPPEEVALALLLIGLFGFTFEGVVGQVGGMAVPRKLSPRRIILGTFPESKALSHLNGFSVPSSPAVAAPPRNYAHEVAHVLGLQHACEGEVPDKGFMPRDCAFSEVGVDVFHAFGLCLRFQNFLNYGNPLPFVFSAAPMTPVRDFMAKPPELSRFWISPYHWVRLLRAMTQGAVDLNLA